MSQTVIQRLAERIRSFGDKNVTKQAIELSRTAHRHDRCDPCRLGGTLRHQPA